MEARIARLESDVAHIKGDIGEIKLDAREIKNDQKVDFRILFGAGKQIHRSLSAAHRSSAALVKSPLRDSPCALAYSSICFSS